MIRGKLSSKLPALGSQRCSLQFRATLAPQEALKVKIPALACAVMWLFVLPEVTKAQDLGDLRHILIVIEELNKETRNLGLTEQSLSDMVLVALKRAVAVMAQPAAGRKRLTVVCIGRISQRLNWAAYRQITC